MGGGQLGEVGESGQLQGKLSLDPIHLVQLVLVVLGGRMERGGGDGEGGWGVGKVV